MAAYHRRNSQIQRSREVEILLVDDNMVVDWLRDMQLYEYVPSLISLRREIIRLQARLAKLRGTTRSGHWDAARKGLLPLLNKFHKLLAAEGYEQLKDYLKERYRLTVTTLVFSESPY